MKDILVYGAGSHAKVVIDAIENEGQYAIVGLIDDNKPIGEQVLGYEIIGPRDIMVNLANSGVSRCVVAIGDNAVRRSVVDVVSTAGIRFASVVHPFTAIGKDVSIGNGTVVFKGTVIDPDVRIGTGVILNNGVTIGHENRIGDYAHLSEGARCGGNVTIGNGTFVGMGAIIISGLTIGENVFIGAGSVVTKDIPDGVTAVGSPARKIKGN